MLFKSIGTGKSTLRCSLQAELHKTVFYGQDESFRPGIRTIEFGKLRGIRKSSKKQ
jgi:hypothetical protein